MIEDGNSIRAADMPSLDDLMMRIYAAMAQKERELISERTRAALVVAKTRGAVLVNALGNGPLHDRAAMVFRSRREPSHPRS